MRVPYSDRSVHQSVHVSVRFERYSYIHFAVPIGAIFTKLAPTVHFDMIYLCHVVVCVLDLHFTLQ